MSMADYVLNMAREAETLEPPMSQKELVSCLTRHFPESIARDLRPALISTLDEMTSILENIESEAKTKTLMAAKRKNESLNNLEKPTFARAIQYEGPRIEIRRDGPIAQQRYPQQYGGQRGPWIQSSPQS